MNVAGFINNDSLKFIMAVLLMLTVFTAAAATIGREEARAVVRGFLDSWETGDSDRFGTFVHKDIEFAYPGGRLGREQLIAMFRQYREKKRDIKIYHWDVFLFQGDRFATAYQFAATDRTSGKRQAVGTGVTGRLQDGKIIEFKEYYDEEVASLQYKGKLPLDEGKVSPWPASVWLRPDTID